jgi:O-antigen ligase
LALAYIAVFVCTQIYDSTIFSSWRTVKDTLSGKDQSFNSTTHRLEMWKESWEYIVKSPIFGVGLDGSGITGFVGGQDRPHNEYIQYALFTGIPGLLAYLTALISLFVSCIRRLKEISNQALIMGAVIVAYCASAFVGNSMYYTTIYYVMFLGFLMGNATASDTNSVS